MDQPGITPRTLTLVLAYLHREVVRWLPGRGMAAGHLQALALWIGRPAADLRTVRAHRLLAGHLAVLRAAGLLQVTGGYWHPMAAAFEWLRADADAQLAWLLRLLPDSLRWAETVAAMALDETLPLDAAAHLQQTLARQMGQGEQAASLGQWVGAESGMMTWQIALPERLAPLVLFHLLQFGDWQPGEWWRCTPLTVAAAGARGYTPLQIELWLGSATGQPVDVERQKELLAWWDEAGAYQVQQVMLLSTRQPSQLAEIAGNRRLYRQFHTQISPRHAVVAPALVPALRRWLAQRGRWLEVPASGEEAGQEVTTEYAWLGLRVLAGLGDLVALPLSLPASALAAAEAGLDPAGRAEMALLATAILDGVRAAVRGRDAFIPAETPVNQTWLVMIEAALAEEQCLEIVYLSPAERRPQARRVQPLRLEQHGELVYLHAYCFLAEGNRVFRLDRLQDCAPAGCEGNTPVAEDWGL